tara:strand:+ start:748 stop:1020 length:273 start_codon:yes stop_codon:yes gene_type:complete
MSDDLKQGVMVQVGHVLESAVSNPKVQMTIATGTTAAGIDLAFIQYLQPVVAIIAAVLGIILTVVLIVKNIMSMIRESREYKYKVKHRDE